MATPKIDIAPELIAQGQRLFEQTDTPQREIAAMLGISRDTLRARLREWNWRRPPSGRAPERLTAVRAAAAAAAEAPPRGPVSVQRRAVLAERIQNVIEREMSAVEHMLDQAGASGGGGAENNARALAGIARTLREVALLNRPDEVTPPDEADDDPIPRDIDEFRNELARRINAFVDARRESESGRPDEDTGALG